MTKEELKDLLKSGMSLKLDVIETEEDYFYSTLQVSLYFDGELLDTDEVDVYDLKKLMENF